MTAVQQQAGDRGRRRAPRVALAVAAALLAPVLAAVVPGARPAPYGDALTRRPGPPAARLAVRLRPDRAVEAYDPATGAPRWRYARTGRRPLAVREIAPDAVALWDDGMVTGSDLRGGTVHWHRAVPGAAGRFALQPLDASGRLFAVVSARRITAYRTRDGDLRWVLPARPGCAFRPPDPALAGGHRNTLVLPQPCGGAHSAAATRLVAVDGLGRVAPGGSPDAPRSRTAPGKLLAGPR